MRVLLVEDSPNDQALVREGFLETPSTDERTELTIAESAKEAQELLATRQFDLVLTDYSLPEQTGLDLLLARREANDPTPVVILTGVADVAVAVTALQEGAADFVVKEIGFERTLPIVARRVREKHASDTEHRRECEQLRERIRRLEQNLDSRSTELRRALREFEALRRVGQALATGDPSAALDLVSKAAAQILQTQAAAVLLRHGSEYVLASAFGTLMQAPGSKAADLPSALDAHWATTLSATMREGRNDIGLLWVGRMRSGRFAKHEVDVLEALADLSALSIAKLRIAEKLRRLNDPPPVPIEENAETEPGSALAATLMSAESAAPGVVDPGGTGVRPTVLVVDDSEKVLAQARSALESSMDVLTATSGRLAIETYATARPALVVIDLTMPELDGYATLAKLQQLGCTNAIAMTLRGDAHSQELARQAGYLGIVEKPFRTQELLTQVAAMLSNVDSLVDMLVDERDTHPILRLPNGVTKPLPSFGPSFLQRLKTFAEQGSPRVILDASALSDVTPEHVAFLVRIFHEACKLGLRVAVCVPDERVIAKLQQIVELRDADYVQTLDAAVDACNAT